MSAVCKRGPFLGSVSEVAILPSQRLSRLCCALIQRGYCYYSQDLKNLREILESHSLEENPIFPTSPYYS